ncbi:alpha/beta fold hydrolase [Limimaricola sp.]|uniref:alpha/beta fold hydrolase n=1 Tax=Limimaricola sp. TaxID=2211665 RepID=UPI004058C556
MALPLLLLPGMMCDARLFAPQVAAFGAAREMILPEIGGHDGMAALAAAVLAGAPPRFALAGLSMGGILAMEVLRQAPGRVDRIALMDTNPRAEAEDVRARRGPQIEAAQAGRHMQVIEEQMIPNYLAPGAARPDIVALCREMARDLGAQVFVNQSRALRDRPDQQETLAAATCPALILCGRHDIPCPIERHERMAALMPHATFTIVEEAGHLPVLERPEHTNAALARWLED